PVDVEKLKSEYRSPDQQIPPSNLAVTRLAGLREQRKSDSIIYGAKSANLGEMLFAKIPGIIVPDGFTVPFAWYQRFMKANRFDEIIAGLTDDNDFVHNPRVRNQKLEEFGNTIQNGKFDPRLRSQIISKW